jgi:hypothetical protein
VVDGWLDVLNGLDDEALVLRIVVENLGQTAGRVVVE